MLYTIEKINQNPDILPGVRLGVLAMDSCDSNIYALEQSLEFIKGSCLFILYYFSIMLIVLLKVILWLFAGQITIMIKP